MDYNREKYLYLKQVKEKEKRKVGTVVLFHLEQYNSHSWLIFKISWGYFMATNFPEKYKEW